MRRNVNENLVSKWSEPVLADGFTVIPNLLIRNLGELDITPAEFTALCALESYRWDAKRDPFPGRDTLAEMIGTTPRTVTRLTTQLVRKGYLSKHQGGRGTNKYDISPLVGRLKEIHKNRQETTTQQDIFDIFGGS